MYGLQQIHIEYLCIAAEITAALLLIALFLPSNRKKGDSDSAPSAGSAAESQMILDRERDLLLQSLCFRGLAISQGIKVQELPWDELVEPDRLQRLKYLDRISQAGNPSFANAFLDRWFDLKPSERAKSWFTLITVDQYAQVLHDRGVNDFESILHQISVAIDGECPNGSLLFRISMERFLVVQFGSDRSQALLSINRIKQRLNVPSTIPKSDTAANPSSGWESMSPNAFPILITCTVEGCDALSDEATAERSEFTISESTEPVRDHDNGITDADETSETDAKSLQLVDFLEGGIQNSIDQYLQDVQFTTSGFIDASDHPSSVVSDDSSSDQSPGEIDSTHEFATHEFAVAPVASITSQKIDDSSKRDAISIQSNVEALDNSVMAELQRDEQPKDAQHPAQQPTASQDAPLFEASSSPDGVATSTPSREFAESKVETVPSSDGVSFPSTDIPVSSTTSESQHESLHDSLLPVGQEPGSTQEGGTQATFLKNQDDLGVELGIVSELNKLQLPNVLTDGPTTAPQTNSNFKTEDETIQVSARASREDVESLFQEIQKQKLESNSSDSPDAPQGDCWGLGKQSE